MLKTEKKIQPNVWGVPFASLRKENPLAELQTDRALVVQLFIWWGKKLFPCCQKEEGEH